ncbi:MAG: hypothetical protein R2867_20545 [Caldilineaceae bacterium]
MVQSMFDWINPKNEVYHCWKSLHVNEINDEVIAIVADRVQNRPTDWTIFDIWAMGETVRSVPADATAMGDAAPRTPSSSTPPGMTRRLLTTVLPGRGSSMNNCNPTPPAAPI